MLNDHNPYNRTSQLPNTYKSFQNQLKQTTKHKKLPPCYLNTQQRTKSFIYATKITTKDIITHIILPHSKAHIHNNKNKYYGIIKWQ